MRRSRNAKIVATVGPASSTPDLLRRLHHAGVDVFRLNFSHGSHEDHAERFAFIRDLERETGRPIGILQDLQGPKIRVGALRNDGFETVAGDVVTFRLEGGEGTPGSIPLPHPEIFEAIMPGHKMMIDDGRLRLDVTGVGDGTIEARVVTGGPVSNRKGVNLPDTVLELSPLTEKDRADLAYGIELGVDYVALSFVQQPADCIECRGLMADGQGLIAKIEKPKALEKLEDIVRLCEGVMVARGDLGVEIPPESVPGRQKEIVALCRRAGKPVIIATQMLDSMVQSPAPTRAEASDVATAVYDGADAVMLSAESASGDYPVEAVTMMDRIIRRTESDPAYRSIVDALEPPVEQTMQHALAAAAALVARNIGARAIVAFTSSGASAVRAARERPEVPIITSTPDDGVARRMALLWGAHPVGTETITSGDQMVQLATERARDDGFAEPGEAIVILSGKPFGTSGTTNDLRIAIVPQPGARAI